MPITYNCHWCGKENTKRIRRDRTYKYCDAKCYSSSKCGKKIESINNFGREPWNKGLIGFMSGENHPNYGKERLDIVDENNPNWAGEGVSYRALHSWVTRKKGKPSKCIFCGDTEKRIEWASKSHKAKRDLDDFIALCVACHRRYDSKRGNFANILY